jgi:hypothetical protein
VQRSSGLLAPSPPPRTRKPAVDRLKAGFMYSIGDSKYENQKMLSDECDQHKRER